MILKIIFSLAVFLAPLAVVAQVKCVMPNRVIITQNLATTCPSGALKGTTFDGKPIELAPTHGKVVVEKSESPADESYVPVQALCEMMKSAGATKCGISPSAFSENTVEATVDTSPANAKRICRRVVEEFHKNPNSVKVRDWGLLIFPPSSDVVLIAACLI